MGSVSHRRVYRSLIILGSYFLFIVGFMDVKNNPEKEYLIGCFRKGQSCSRSAPALHGCIPSRSSKVDPLVYAARSGRAATRPARPRQSKIKSGIEGEIKIRIESNLESRIKSKVESNSNKIKSWITSKIKGEKRRKTWGKPSSQKLRQQIG